MSVPPPPGPAPIIQIGAAGVKKKDFNKTPQELVSEFWDKFFTKKPGKVTSIFPRRLYATLLPPDSDRGAATVRNAAESYEAAARECRERINRVVRECNRTNEKFTDPDFDIESDNQSNCLNGLVRDDYDIGFWDESNTAVSPWALKSSLDTLANSRLLGEGAAVPVDISAMRDYLGEGGGGGGFSFAFSGARGGPDGEARARSGQELAGQPKASLAKKPTPGPRKTRVSRNGVKCGEYYSPGSIHRLDWIFESPKFTIDGFAASDIKQGGNGDCWWLAAVATIAHRKDLMERVCVARDEEVGVYGFVFQRDGDFVPVLVDDNLYLEYENFDFYGDQYDSTGKRAREHRKRFQTGSEALYFAKCDDPNETWLPLLEKAYAKVHGDYEAISGGWSGEAVEDMTGGVATTIATNRVLRKDKLWRELVNPEGEFVFALSAIGTGWDWKKGGLAMGHAYSILKATEEVGEDGEKVRLVLIRNPWGQRSRSGIGEWNGSWSDGSKEWTPYWLKKLGHTFGDDGIFWMSYTDMLDTFMFLHRTRLFDEKWTVVQQWTSVDISWVTGYLQSKFVLEVKKGGLVVICLTQLDERYFVGLEGQYNFALHFILQEVGAKPGDHICRVRPVHDWENRSVSCEVQLEAGKYEVIPKITAERQSDKKMVEDIVKEWAEKNPQKLRQIGMQYDLAHAKGGVTDEDLLLQKKNDEKKKKEEEKKKKEKEKKRKEKEKKRKERREQKEREKKEKEEAARKEKEEKEKEESKKREEAKSKTDEVKELSKDENDEKSDDKKTKGDEEGAVSDSKTETEKSKESDTSAKDDKQVEDKKETTAPEKATSTEKKDDPEKKDEDKKTDSIEAAARPAVSAEEKIADDSEDDEDDEDDEEESKVVPVEDDDANPPWNAICVVGLRVYSSDPEVSVKLVKTKDAEEASSLSVDSTAAGATM